MNNPDFTTDINNIDADTIRARWQKLKNGSFRYRVSFVLDRKDWEIGDVLNSIEKMTCNLRDAAIFLSEVEYKKFDEDLSQSIQFGLTPRTLPREINEEIDFWMNKVKIKKREFLIEAAAQFYEQVLDSKIDLFSISLNRRLKLSPDEITPRFLRDVTGYNIKQADRIQSYFPLDYEEYKEAVQVVINERFISRVPSKSLRDLLEIQYTPYYFPAFEIQYKLLGTDCLRLVLEIYAIVDVEVHKKKQLFPLRITSDTIHNCDIKDRILGYYDEFISPKDLDTQPLEVIMIPIRLLYWLIEGGTMPYGINILDSSKKEVTYTVDGYPDKIKTPVKFIKYLKELSGGKGFNGLRAKLVENGLMYEGTDHVIEEQMKPKPVGSLPSLKPKVIERLEIIQKNPSPLHYSVWGTKFGTTRQNAFDYLRKLHKEGTAILTPESDGARVELTDKGLQMLRQGKSLNT